MPAVFDPDGCLVESIEPIGPGWGTPGQPLEPNPPAGLMGRTEEKGPTLELRDDALDHIEAELHSGAAHIVIQNAAFDMGVIVAERPHLLPLVFAAYDAGRIRCTLVREKLIKQGGQEEKGPDATFLSTLERQMDPNISDEHGFGELLQKTPAYLIERALAAARLPRLMLPERENPTTLRESTCPNPVSQRRKAC